MSEHHLPDDYRQWPTDPYELLGVARGADARDIKRAYTRLIRQFKPEHSPEQFRLIRDAYEAATRMAAFYTSFTAAPTPETTPPQHTDRPEPIRLRTTEESATAAWNTAINGDLATAYRMLHDLVELSPHHHERYAQLYWLLAIEPTLDPQRTRLEWLFLGLERTGLHETLIRLFAEEGRANPTLYRSERASLLLTAQAKPAALRYYVEERWREMLRREWWEDIATDFAVVRTGPLRDQLSSWLALLVLLLDRLVWKVSEAAQQLRQLIRREVATLESHALHEPHWFDRIDYGLALVEDLKQCNAVDESGSVFVALIRASWYSPFEELVPLLEKWLGLIEHNPLLHVEQLFTIQRTAPLVYQQLYWLSYEYCGLAGVETEPPSRELWRHAGAAVAWDKIGEHYTHEQGFQFCWRHFLDPRAVVSSFQEAYPNLPPSDYPAWTRFFSLDTPYHLVLRCHRALHRTPARS